LRGIVVAILVVIVVGRSGATVPTDKDYDNDHDDDLTGGTLSFPFRQPP
jgi:uncharacterized membrane protein